MDLLLAYLFRYEHTLVCIEFEPSTVRPQDEPSACINTVLTETCIGIIGVKLHTCLGPFDTTGFLYTSLPAPFRRIDIIR